MNKLFIIELVGAVVVLRLILILILNPHGRFRRSCLCESLLRVL
jgi:hypothetical protein